ncbi:hypothetical protein XENOCAPTIV_014664, partial [Xenoophorus captivus]
MRPGCARPRLSLIVMDPLSRARVFPDTKERGGPWAMLHTGAALQDSQRWPR